MMETLIKYSRKTLKTIVSGLIVVSVLFVVTGLMMLAEYIQYAGLK